MGKLDKSKWNAGRNAQLLVGAVAILVLGAMAYGSLVTGGGPEVGQPAPDFTLQTLDGGIFQLSKERGRVVVLNFWASWCPPCQEEAPALAAAAAHYEGADVVFVGIAFKEVHSKAQRFLAEHGLTYLNGVDSRGDVSALYRVRKVPETFVVDRQGVLAFHHIGQVSEQRLLDMIEEALTR